MQEAIDLVVSRVFDALAAVYTHFAQPIPAELSVLRQLGLQRGVKA